MTRSQPSSDSRTNKPTPNAEPRTTREALVAVMLGEIDGLLERVDALTGSIDQAEARLAASVAALDAAGERYRTMIHAFTQTAKAETTDYLERKTAEVTETTIARQRTAMQEAARMAFQAEVADKTSALCAALEKSAVQIHRPLRSRLGELVVTAGVAAGTAAGLAYVFLK